MSSMIGNKIKVSIFGQSHSKAIGVVIDGLPAGEKIDFEEILSFMARRVPGKSNLSTNRSEADYPEILSGLVDDYTCGAPLAAIIHNNDAKSSDYNNLKTTPRPSHADYTAFLKYHGFHDIRGGGHFSGRLTAPLVFAGAICSQILKRRGIHIGAHIYSIEHVNDTAFETVELDINTLENLKIKPFPVLCDESGIKMKTSILDAKEQLDSVGGVIEVAAVGVPVGIGNPMFDGVENRISAAMFAIPAVKGIEFGAGFEAAKLRGSKCNDAFYFSGDEVLTKTNHHGGILGGISSGMPIIARVAIKPTPSIALPQESVNLQTHQNELVTIKGRHDPCIVPRAVPCTEAVFAITILDLLMDI